uniref:Uncharacterized protein n=1 Tax=Arundo donax TaxID=35708 RepID=A0A0A9DCW5_ARUDO
MSQRCSPITPFHQYKTRTIYNINPVEVQKGDIFALVT